MAETYDIGSTRHLPDHDRILQALLKLFSGVPGVIGCYLSGSMATNKMDEDSDLDIAIVFDSSKSREACWGTRWDWDLPDWFHRMDADHIKPYLVIYLFEPQIKGDINLYITSDLPPYEGGPFLVVWDDTGVLTEWQHSQVPSPMKHVPEDIVHDDERFWAWMFYLFNHVHRGEYYHCASEFYALRDILERWVALLVGKYRFNSRHLEDQHFADPLFENDLFPKPDLVSLKTSMLDAIRVQLSLRPRIAQADGLTWKTADEAISKIEGLVDDL